MDINSERRVAANVAALISTHPLTTVAQAADMREEDLNARLHGHASFTVNDLVRVGGFLRLPAAQFMEGLTA
ncbi:hypothetical protein [Microbacterium telephonicum]|uniref:BetR domain-containing protein n=1 Tax=Microbacterium telephonicum TaxID=1714841 RepID=A0A498BV05_9MICO|nr:hypothetical protein [Microbacterium telephonicum]RLK47653.1 hypothetical protein C7474_2248 [Microbacterium telephonicum]